MANRVLVLYAHPGHETSQSNRRLRTAIEGLDGVTVHDLYESYPDFFIDVRREQKLLLAHEVLVLQHPVYWYSAPAILKEWMDVVLEYGWAYGPGGHRLAGKYFMLALTTGGTEEFYGRGGRHNFTLHEFLRPFEQTAHLCNMVYLPPFVTHAARQIEATDLDVQAGRYRAALEQLVRGEMPARFHTISAED